MLSNQSNQTLRTRATRLATVSAVLGMTLVLTGCSADVSRFDLGKYSYSNSDGPTGSLPTPSQPMAADPAPEGRLSESYPRSQSANKSAYNSYERKYSSTRDEIAARRERAATATADVRSSRLSDLPEPRQQKRLVASLPKQSRVTSGDQSRGFAAAQSITVERGDTLYGLSRRHGVTVAALMRANGLRSANIRPGQSLTLPGNNEATGRAAPADNSYRTASAPSDTMRTAVPAASPAASYVADAGAGSYTIRSGDSLYRIAKEHGLRTAQLVAANPSVNPRRLRPGQRLILPAAGSIGRNVSDDNVSGRAPRVVTRARLAYGQKAPRQVASRRGDTMNDAAPGIHKIKPRKPVATRAGDQMASLAPSSKLSLARPFRWPVKGKVISNFGLRNDGTHNDGINLSVPMGTSVQAAENGVVAYAGSELKGYGKLILVRHDKNWVTTYAHNSKIMVKRGDKIRRGQIIAMAGNSGTVDQPQLHFELRKGSKPVNPLPYMQSR